MQRGELLSRLTGIDYGIVTQIIGGFLRSKLEEAGAAGYVLGLSGGVDSSTAAALTAKTVGAEKVFGLILPDSTSTPAEDVRDARWLAETLGIRHHILPIDEIVRAFTSSVPFYDPLNRVAMGNLKARIRMMILYYYANLNGLLVLGSSDKSELLLGYFTKYGDGGADVLPLADLYKTQVRMLARHLGLPDSIAFKPSSPRLWPGQTAEGELGFSYETADQILYALVDLGLGESEIAAALNVPSSVVQEIKRRVSATRHKREMPPKPTLRGIVY